jgi:hypothetical protein
MSNRPQIRYAAARRGLEEGSPCHRGLGNAARIGDFRSLRGLGIGRRHTDAAAAVRLHFISSDWSLFLAVAPLRQVLRSIPIELIDMSPSVGAESGDPALRQKPQGLTMMPEHRGFAADSGLQMNEP